MMADDYDSAEKPKRPSAAGTVKSAMRVIEVLDLLGRWRGDRSHNQIAEELNIPKSSLSQLLKTLVQREYLTYLPESRTYALGPAIDKLAAQARRTRDLAEVAQPVLEWLSETTSESIALNYMNGDSHEVVATILSPRRIVAHLRLGEKAPLHATSGGQVILAHLTTAQQESYLKRADYQRFARNSLMDAAAVRNKLARIAADGFAVVVEEFTPGIGGIARPVFGPNRVPLASLSVTVPVDRFNSDFQEQANRSLARAVTSLSHRAGLG
ncbi:MAG: IclR family transcriptional regulator [Rhodospirillales bacterium]|nr:IclR family transcriptional regulator [Rhodospirillales bacterium]